MKNLIKLLSLLLALTLCLFSCSQISGEPDGIDKIPPMLSNLNLDIEEYPPSYIGGARVTSNECIFDINNVNLRFHFGSHLNTSHDVKLCFKNSITEATVEVCEIKNYPSQEHRINGFYAFSDTMVFDGVTERKNYSYSCDLTVPSELFTDNYGQIEFYVYYTDENGSEVITNAVSFRYKLISGKVAISENHIGIDGEAPLITKCLPQDIKFLAGRFIGIEKAENIPLFGAKPVAFDVIEYDGHPGVAVGYKKGNDCYIRIFDDRGRYENSYIYKFNYDGDFKLDAFEEMLFLYLEDDRLAISLDAFNPERVYSSSSLIYNCPENDEYLEGLTVSKIRTHDGNTYSLSGATLTVTDKDGSVISSFKVK